MTESNNKVGIDSGMLLLVDPGEIPVEVLEKILKPNGYGYTAGVVVEVPGGDCTLGIYPGDVGPLEIESGCEPCMCEGVLDCEICEEFGVYEYAKPWKVVSEETIDMILSEWSKNNTLRHEAEIDRQVVEAFKRNEFLMEEARKRGLL